jgi:hypothetical protein
VLDGRTQQYGRTTPLAGLLAHLDDSRRPLQSELATCGGFMRVLEAVRRAADPVPIPPQFLLVRGAGDERRIDVAGVERAVRDAAERLRTFTELGVPWATSTLRRAG